MLYVFFRAEGFYPIEIPPGWDTPEKIAEHAALNPGTLRIENAVTREIVWQEPIN